MVDVTIQDDRARFNVEGLDKLWSFRSAIEIPLAHITDVEADPEQVGRWWHGFKLIGTDVPGLFAAGTFYYHGELVFWDVRDPARTVVVSLEHERYKKLIIEVSDVRVRSPACAPRCGRRTGLWAKTQRLYAVTADTSVFAKSPPLNSSGSPVDWDSAKEKQSP